MIKYGEDFMRKLCDDGYLREQIENITLPTEDKPKFPDKDILDIAIDGAEVFSSNDNAKNLLKNNLI